MNLLTLSRDELHALTGRRHADAQARVLAALGIAYKARPDGSLAVLRAVVEAAMGAKMAAPPEPRLHL